MTEESGHPTPQMECVRRRCREQSREQIERAREKALICRRHFDDQLAAHGAVGRELHADLAAAALSYHRRIRVFEDDYSGELPDMEPLEREVSDFDGHVADNPATPAKQFAAFVDATDAVAVKLGLVSGSVEA